MLHNSIIDPNLLLQGYANGVFPMADNAKSNEVYWVEPKLRGINPQIYKWVSCITLSKKSY